MVGAKSMKPANTGTSLLNVFKPVTYFKGIASIVGKSATVSKTHCTTSSLKLLVFKSPVYFKATTTQSGSGVLIIKSFAVVSILRYIGFKSPGYFIASFSNIGNASGKPIPQLPSTQSWTSL